ncbi:MAG: serine/threonine protein kinase [candidate division KSB1 bacterium]|nr:serine/threonine protein kinase [candidate division KSB1 bacterium]MDZ7300453.1 serine/threonine protein kinase [candidate division KSB1 bacterium]MDZ7308631.1 serine/threonine protein kinase [candidate division KSB1 bacterium]MDZ7351445.1 serine/threonine protein kinase [candidate division KSB1 bacterium]MDZ7355804.1 serine/threonine protein kinase [candidate division KSB1 bacterium]
MANLTKRMPAADPTKRMPGGAAETKRMPEGFTPTAAVSMRPGERIDGKYEIVKALSDAGGEAEVYLCHDLSCDGRKVVVKLYRGNFKPKRDVVQQLKGLKHEDIIAVFDFGEWSGRFYEVMEYARGGPVYEPGRSMSEAQVIQIVKEINNALHFCHRRGIIHRDLKPTNLFYRNPDKTDVVLGDFGISSIMEEGEELHKTTAHHTTHFSAPEQYLNQVHPKTDYYALGITILTLLKGRSPFEGWTDEAVYTAHVAKKVDIPASCSPRLQSLLAGLLTKAIDDRWGYEQVTRWLNGEEVEVRPARTERHAQPFLVGPGLSAHTLPELAEMLHHNWQHGLGILGRKADLLCAWVKEEDEQRAREIRAAIEQPELSWDEKLMQVICWLDPGRPYLLAPGYSAATPQELAQQIYSNERTWQAGRDQLFNGLLPIWLRTRFGVFAAEWERHKADFKEHKDQGLDYFVRLLDRTLPPPQIAVSPAKLDFGKIGAGQEKALSLAIANPGRGYLHGKITSEGAPTGLRLSTAELEGNQNQVTVTLRVSATAGPGKQQCDLRLKTNAGESEILIPCTYRVISAAAARAGGGTARLAKALFGNHTRQVAQAMLFGALLGFLLRLAVMFGNPAVWQRRTMNFAGQSWESVMQRSFEFGRSAPVHYVAFLLFALFLAGWAWRRAARK